MNELEQLIDDFDENQEVDFPRCFQEDLNFLQISNLKNYHPPSSTLLAQWIHIKIDPSDSSVSFQAREKANFAIKYFL